MSGAPAEGTPFEAASIPTMRIAIVNYAFPVTTQTFHYRRQRVLLESGVLSGLHFVRPGGGVVEHASAPLPEIAQEIRWVDRVLGLSGLLRPSVVTVLLRGLLLARRDNGEGGRRGFLFQAINGAGLARRFRRQRPDVVHASFSEGAGTVAMFASLVGSVPLSMEVHTPATAEGNPALLRLKLERAALVTAISEYAADLVRRIAPGALVHVVHCGLDPLGSDDSGDQADPGGAFDVVAVGSLVEKKGHVHLIQASALLCERLPHTVAIVGDGPLRKELEAAIHATGAPVRLLGELPPDETRNVLRATRVCALACVRTDAGDEDGIPVALMEAMQLGVPVVSTCVSGIPELLDGGRAGALVDPGDPVALASALEMALTDEGWRDHAASLAADRIADGFDNRTETLRLVELLAAVARRGYSGEGTGWHG